MDTAIDGFHHIKLPVADLARSREWYARVLGLQTHIEFTENGVLMGAGMHGTCSVMPASPLRRSTRIRTRRG
jgi:catechol-2,3-dioxygenase